MRSSIVYKFTCPKCNLGTYVGCTDRMLKVRMDCHKGVSYRTGTPLNVKEFSPIRDHCKICKVDLNYNQIEIIEQNNNRQDLLILESLSIKINQPTLNNDSSSLPLYIA